MKRSASIALALSMLGGAAFADFNAAPPNVPSQKPAFENQTRAPVIAPQFEVEAQTLVTGLDSPWGLAVLPDGSLLVTERGGTMRRIATDGTLSDPIAGLPKVMTEGQGGLLDVAIAPDFAKTRQVWFSFSEPQADGSNNTAVGTGRLSEDGTQLEGTRTIFSQKPSWKSNLHFGSRLVFDREGMLFVTTGERSNPEPRQLAQNLTTHLGKVLRIDPQTGAPANPKGNFPGANAQPEIWSYGHRNLQAAALAPDGQLWTVEHGPEGGDELNHPEAGKNYGWPIITYGQDYSGAPIGQGITQQEGMEQPVYYWDPVIAPSGMTFYDGPMFPEMKGDILIGGLRGQALVRLKLDKGRVVGEQRFLEGIGRVRDVVLAPDGSLYLLLEDKGQLVRVLRKG